MEAARGVLQQQLAASHAAVAAANAALQQSKDGLEGTAARLAAAEAEACFSLTAAEAATSELQLAQRRLQDAAAQQAAELESLKSQLWESKAANKELEKALTSLKAGTLGAQQSGCNCQAFVGLRAELAVHCRTPDCLTPSYMLTRHY